MEGGVSILVEAWARRVGWACKQGSDTHDASVKCRRRVRNNALEPLTVLVFCLFVFLSSGGLVEIKVKLSPHFHGVGGHLPWVIVEYRKSRSD